MGNKGFTLVELLGVVVIFAVLVVSITIVADSTLKKSKTKLSNTQIEYIEESAQIYYLKEGINNSYNNKSFKMCVDLNYLIENDYIENDEILDPKDYEKLDGSVEIIYKSNQFTYKYQESSCDYEYQSLDKICYAVTEETRTTGNVPIGNYDAGDEYICEVKLGVKYHFFVLDVEEENVNLIMEKNIFEDGTLATSINTGMVEWYAMAADHSYGPITAMDYLYKATKEWDNIPNMKMDYEDENVLYFQQQKGTLGYGGIKTANDLTKITMKDGTIMKVLEGVEGYSNLKARLPKYSEVHGEGKCLTTDEYDDKYGSCPLWLSNYLSNSEYVTGEGLQNIEGILGYWTLSSSATDDLTNKTGAWNVRYLGNIDDDNVQNTTVNKKFCGIRPVISIPKLDIAN